MKLTDEQIKTLEQARLSLIERTTEVERHDQAEIDLLQSIISKAKNELASIMTDKKKRLCDLRTIRDYLRDRRDELYEQGWHSNAKQIGDEVSRLNILIAEAEAEA